MTPRKHVSLLVLLLCGVIALAGWGAARLQVIGSSDVENSASGDSGSARGATSSNGDASGALDEPAGAMISAGAATPESEPPETAPAVAACSADERPVLQALLLESHLTPQPETRLQSASLSMSTDVKEHPEPVVRPIEIPDQCLAAQSCIDDYLWSLYERAPKIDTNKVTQRIKATLKKKGKSLTVTKTIIKYVVGDFSWKDPNAAQRAHMSLKDYVIGGVDRGFRLKLYHALRAMENAGLMPGITSAFRDDYRQSIASGKKAASDSSYHGGSRRGGYGHALAVDLVSVKGETRMERYASSEKLWKWIDAHEHELGIGRPYLDRDPPHVAPVDGREYADKRGRAKAQLAGLKKPSVASNLK